MLGSPGFSRETEGLTESAPKGPEDSAQVEWREDKGGYGTIYSPKWARIQLRAEFRASTLIVVSISARD